MTLSRSIRRSPSLCGSPLPLTGTSGRRPIVSTTSVAPSHRPREVPNHDASGDSDRGLPSSGMRRTSVLERLGCITNSTRCGVCTISSGYSVCSMLRGVPSGMQKVAGSPAEGLKRSIMLRAAGVSGKLAGQASARLASGSHMPPMSGGVPGAAAAWETGLLPL